MGIIDKADGSAYVEQGNTKALATVHGPHEVDRRIELNNTKSD